MKILVTGAAGMIGSYLIKTLIAVGYEVVGVDRRTCIPMENMKSVVVDLGNAEEIKKVVLENQVDRIIHLAALAHTTGEADLSYEKYYQVNVDIKKLWEDRLNTELLDKLLAFYDEALE